MAYNLATKKLRKGKSTGTEAKFPFSKESAIIVPQTSPVKQISEEVPSVPEFPRVSSLSFALVLRRGAGSGSLPFYPRSTFTIMYFSIPLCEATDG